MPAVDVFFEEVAKFFGGWKRRLSQAKIDAGGTGLVIDAADERLLDSLHSLAEK